MKRAQVQTGETIFAVIIIVIIIVILLQFTGTARQEEIIRDQDRFNELDAIRRAQFVTALKELSCFEFEIAERSCFDVYKLQAYQRLREEQWDSLGEYYFGQFGEATLLVNEITIDTGEEREWLLYDNKPFYGDIQFSTTAQQGFSRVDAGTDGDAFSYAEYSLGATYGEYDYTVQFDSARTLRWLSLRYQHNLDDVTTGEVIVEGFSSGSWSTLETLPATRTPRMEQIIVADTVEGIRLRFIVDAERQQSITSRVYDLSFSEQPIRAETAFIPLIVENVTRFGKSNFGVLEVITYT